MQQAWIGPESILTEAERAGFAGVPYFPYDSTYRVGARYVSLGAARPIAVPSSAGTDHAYLPVARLHFALDGEGRALTVYRGLNAWSEEDHYFVMFYDATNGAETYGGGRYLELDPPPATSANATLDFNYSYHPYCAYSDRYSCPIPPPENRLGQAVRAGVRLEEGGR